LTLPGSHPLPLSEIAAAAHDMQLVTGAMVHAFDRWGWAEADFNILGERSRRPIDGLAIQTGAEQWQRIERHNVHYMDPQLDNASWSRFVPVSALVELSIKRDTGEVQLLAHHSGIDCGQILVPEFVSGQLQGGI